MLVILIAIAYQNILSYEFVIDDIGAVDAYKKFSDLIPFFKSPAQSVNSLMYFLMYNAGHGAPWPFHLVSLIFHIGVVILIYLIISKMINKHVAFLTAIFAAIHPIFVESVTWISGSPYVEYSFFCLLSFYFYLYVDKKTYDRHKENKQSFNKSFYFYSLLAYVAATLFSHKAAVFPLLLVVYEIAFGNLKKNWKRFIPFVALSFLWLLFYFPVAQNRITENTAEYHLEKGLDNPLQQIPIAITSYFHLIFWPDKLSIYQSELHFGIGETILQALVSIGLIGLIVWMYKKNRMIFFWLCWFVVSLLPTLLPFRISWVFAERYVYLGAMGILAIVSIGIYQIIKRPSYRTLGILLMIALTAGLIVRTYVRNLAWSTEDDLWLATAETSPSDFKTHNNVGTVYLKRGDVARAEKEFILAITLNKHYADAYYNLGLLYMNYNVMDRAERFYLQAIKEKPTFWQAYNGLSIVYIANKNFEKGEVYAKKTIALKPNEPNGYTNLGLVYQVTNRPKEAIVNYRKATELNPALWQTYFNLTMKRSEEAREALLKSLELNPGDKDVQKALDSIK